MYLFYILFFILGLFCGSLVNYIAGGLTREPRAFVFSECRECSKSWWPLLMLPIVGFALARARCPYCGRRLHVHIILVEIFTGLLFACILWRFGFSWELSLLIIYSLLLLILLVTDLEKMLIPNAVTYPGMAMVLILSVVIMLLNFHPRWFFAIPVTGWWGLINNYLVSVIIGALTGMLPLLLVAIIYPRGMGLGDVKLAALIGLMTGFPVSIVALFLGIFIGGLVSILLLLTGRRGHIPFGPFLCLGGMAALIWGKAILLWYLSPIL